MATWRKHFQLVPRTERYARYSGAQGADYAGANASGGKFSSYLPEVYSGAPNRLERYQQYDQMNLDSEVNISLNIISDFSTETPETEDTPFFIYFKDKDEVTETESSILRTALQQWVSINDFNTRLWRIFRSTICYGDQFFVRDPETFEWIWIDQYKVKQVIVNEAEGKKPEQYIVADLDLNLQSKVGTIPRYVAINQVQAPIQSMVGKGASQYSQTNMAGSYSGKLSGAMGQQGDTAIEAENVVHLSLSEGLDASWPFGNSILEAIFKVFKQKELLEDSLIIYRVQRAPERRVFYVDVGNMPPNKANAYIERVKNEIWQRRIPNRTGGGTSILDAAYNPLSIIEDYFFAQTADGRGSKVDTLPAGENLGQIDDLKYFNNKMMRGLGVPSAYLPTGPDDGTQSYTDGRVGTAYIQEYRFAKNCARLQRLLSRTFDKEFKLFLSKRGLRIDPAIFELRFHPPQNFSRFRQIEIDAAQINVFQPLAEVKYFSKRFLQRRFLGMTEAEILENEKLWMEENAKRVKAQGGGAVEPTATPGLGDVGIRPAGGLAGLPGAEEVPGAEGAPGEAGAEGAPAPEAGAAGGAPTPPAAGGAPGAGV
jgi:hypothetical protein